MGTLLESSKKDISLVPGTAMALRFPVNLPESGRENPSVVGRSAGLRWRGFAMGGRREAGHETPEYVRRERNHGQRLAEAKDVVSSPLVGRVRTKLVLVAADAHTGCRKPSAK